MRVVLFLSGIFFVCMIAAGCKKPHNSISGGGLGGNCTISVSGEHHGDLLDTCIVYIKYGTLDEPANNVYDDSDSVVLTGGTPVAVFKNLTVGLYYLQAVGYHGAYSPPNVKGGIPVTVSTSGTTTNVVIPTYEYIP